MSTPLCQADADGRDVVHVSALRALPGCALSPVRILGHNTSCTGHGPLPVPGGFLAKLCKQAASSASNLFPQVVDHCLSKVRVLFAVHRISPLDQARQPHSIQVAVTCAHTDDDLQKAAKALEGAVQQVGSWGLAGRKATCRKHWSCCKKLSSSWLCTRDARTWGMLQRTLTVLQTAVQQMGCCCCQTEFV